MSRIRSILRRAAPKAVPTPTGDGHSVRARLVDGPLRGKDVTVSFVSGRAPGTLDRSSADGSTCRYGLVEWEQSGSSARYEFLYVVT